MVAAPNIRCDRYTFNGMERDDEVKGSGNSYDYGARMYDSRLGRWLSIDNYDELYPSHSPYGISMNSPILLADADGNIIRDPKGNIVATSTGQIRTSQVLFEQKEVFGGTMYREIYREYEVMTIYADDGTPIEALKLVKAEIIETFVPHGASSPSNQIVTDITNDKSEFDAAADCHGHTFVGNSLWINDDQVNNILDHDNVTPSADATQSDFVVYKSDGKVIHSATRNEDGTYDNNAGFSTMEYGTDLQGASRGLTDTSKRGNAEHYKRDTETVVRFGTGVGVEENGYIIVSESEANKAIRNSESKTQYVRDTNKPKSRQNN